MAAINITETIKRFREVVEYYQRYVMDIWMAQPDEDAIGCAIAMFHLLRALKCRVRIFYTGAMAAGSWPRLVSEYRLNRLIRPDEDFRLSVSGNVSVLVDSSSVRDGRLLGRKLNPFCILDHHTAEAADLGKCSPQFRCIDPTVGAASTLAVELWRKMEIFTAPSLSRRDRQLVALALAFGIYSDTHGFRDATARDVQASEFLIGSFLRGTREWEMYEEMRAANIAENLRWGDYYESYAERQCHWEGKDLIANLGQIPRQHIHVGIAEVADRWLSLHGEQARLIIVFGLYPSENGERNDTDLVLKASVRSKGFLDSDTFQRVLHTIFTEHAGGRVVDGLANGGVTMVLEDYWRETSHDGLDDGRGLPEHPIVRRISQRLQVAQ